jgi:coproporphyrinogen III oxidase
MNERLLENSMLAKQIAETLKEKEVELIHAVVHVKGDEFSLNVLAKVMQVVEEGGLLKKNGEKRTPGGIFFMMVKELVNKDEEKMIFKSQVIERRRRARARKKITKMINNLSI